MWSGLVAHRAALAAQHSDGARGSVALQLHAHGRAARRTPRRGRARERAQRCSRGLASPQHFERAPCLRVLGAATTTPRDARRVQSPAAQAARDSPRGGAARAARPARARARPDEARRALRRLAQKLHPDRFQRESPALRALSQRSDARTLARRGAAAPSGAQRLRAERTWSSGTAPRGGVRVCALRVRTRSDPATYFGPRALHCWRASTGFGTHSDESDDAVRLRERASLPSPRARRAAASC